MTRIDFHFNAPPGLIYPCRLARKIVRAGQRAVFHHPDVAWLQRFNDELWSFSPQEFIAHVMADDPVAAQTPIVLAAAARDDLDCSLLVNMGLEPPPFFSRFERLIELVSAEDSQRDAGRQRFRFYRERGYPIETHDLAKSA
jgi:DNA polymerase-3 subunit chi